MVPQLLLVQIIADTFEKMAHYLWHKHFGLFHDVYQGHIHLGFLNESQIFADWVDWRELNTKLMVSLVDGNVLNVYENFLNWNILFCTDHELESDRINQNGVHLLVLIMELFFLVVDPVKEILYIREFGQVRFEKVHEAFIEWYAVTTSYFVENWLYVLED